jgi:tetratricopeptide (TPR) repeat protein
MKNNVLHITIFICCLTTQPLFSQTKTTTDNEELITLYNEDQSDRQTDNINWIVVSKRDSTREARVYQLLKMNLVRTGMDHYNAAMIFQHGHDTTASGNAVRMMRKAIALDPSINKWLLAAAIDRDLMRRGEMQIYGTQFVKNGDDDPWKLYSIDTTKISDQERLEYGVETLAEQRLKVKLMNKRKISALYAEGKKIEEIVKICREGKKAESTYDISDRSINIFGYELMAKQKYEEALKIFALNVELYPQEWNTYDSYGECLLKMGNKKEAIKAYTRSLELNPKNQQAQKVLEELKVN